MSRPSHIMHVNHPIKDLHAMASSSIDYTRMEESLQKADHSAISCGVDFEGSTNAFDDPTLSKALHDLNGNIPIVRRRVTRSLTLLENHATVTNRCAVARTVATLALSSCLSTPSSSISSFQDVENHPPHSNQPPSSKNILSPSKFTLRSKILTKAEVNQLTQRTAKIISKCERMDTSVARELIKARDQLHDRRAKIRKADLNPRLKATARVRRSPFGPTSAGIMRATEGSVSKLTHGYFQGEPGTPSTKSETELTRAINQLYFTAATPIDRRISTTISSNTSSKAGRLSSAYTLLTEGHESEEDDPSLSPASLVQADRQFKSSESKFDNIEFSDDSDHEDVDCHGRDFHRYSNIKRGNHTRKVEHSCFDDTMDEGCDVTFRPKVVVHDTSLRNDNHFCEDNDLSSFQDPSDYISFKHPILRRSTRLRKSSVSSLLCDSPEAN